MTSSLILYIKRNIIIKIVEHLIKCCERLYIRFRCEQLYCKRLFNRKLYYRRFRYKKLCVINSCRRFCVTRDYRKIYNL